jgi:NAD(P)-dependent dehydrogenase (short-subunit alcohol dehydrogenase family)
VRGVDVIINNAGIADRTPVSGTDADTVQKVVDTNVLGPVRVVRTFGELLDASACPVVLERRRVGRNRRQRSRRANCCGALPSLNWYAKLGTDLDATRSMWGAGQAKFASKTSVLRAATGEPCAAGGYSAAMAVACAGGTARIAAIALW